MAHPETIGYTTCEGKDCGERVAVKKNRVGLAYYRCDGCGREVRHHWDSSSEKFLQQFRPSAPAPAAPEPEKSRNSPPAAPAKSSILSTLLG